MSNQFYKYLSKRLLEFLETNLTKVGERYYLQLDEENQVEEFYEILKSDNRTEKFIYKHEKGEVYETIAININGIKLVVASTINTTSAYLVTIRNCSERQEGVWKNTSIFILCGEPIDSIKSGCKNLTSDGMPFNTKYISLNLNNDIEKSNLPKVDKEVLKFYVKKKLADLYNTSLWDYEDILSILNKGSVEKEDYKKIGLFIDKSLETYTPKEMVKRLLDNSSFYEKVLEAQEYEDKDSILEKYFDDSGVKKLKKDDWEYIDYSEVKQSNERNSKLDRALKYIEKSDKTLSYDRVYWEKEKSDTAAGRRKRQIIVFNNGSKEDIKLKFEFDQELQRQFIESKSEKYISLSGKKLTITIKPEEKESSFYKLAYSHNKQSKSKFEFNIAVVNIKENYLEKIKAKYEIIGYGSKGRIKVNNDGLGVILGSGNVINEINIDKSDDLVILEENESIKISNYSEAWDEGSLRFILATEKGTIPMEISEESSKSKRISSIGVWKHKRELKESFKWENNRIRIGTKEYYLEEKLKSTFELEKKIIEGEVLYGEVDIDSIKKENIKLSEELIQAYKKIIEYYKHINNVPSLTFIDKELNSLYKNFLNIFNSEIERINEAEILEDHEEKLNLIKVGTIRNGDQMIVTPFSPINIAYQLEIYESLKDESIEAHILERLRPNNLVPYLYGEKNKLYRPIYQKDNVEWIIFEKSEQVSIGETNAFMAKVVKEKLEQFINHFKYLFPKSSKAPIKINLINIKNDREIVKGIYEYIKKQIFDNKRNIIPVEIRIFNEENITAFDEFFSYTSIEKLEESFNISLSGKNKDFDNTDVIRLVLENIKYYKYGNSKDYTYSHISFYKIGQDDRDAKDTTSNMESGLSLGGLLSTISSNRNGDNYRTGFGSKNILDKNKLLIRTAININELASNLDNNGGNPYRKDTSIVTKPLVLKEETREKLYNSSHWVTFIEPNFGLEYFEKVEDNNNLIVMHYSDQYTTTDQYDTITVTNKSDQYIYIIEEFLRKKNIKISKEEANKIIKSFNSINGEWLLNLIANKSQFDREKLSIISAIKYGLAILNHEDIIWIPISLEEIFRVSSAVKLNKSEGVFSLKNLKQKGIHSDDLIFIGINIKNVKKLKLYYYPVEVKIGYNFENVLQKGKDQIDKTYDVLVEQLSQLTKNGKKLFRNMFFRNFFIQLLISNEQKLSVNNLWREKNIERIEEFKKYLFNDEYEVSFELEDYIGKGALISFKKDNNWRSVNLDEGKLRIELTEDDAYRGVKYDINDIYENIISGNTDIDLTKLLYGKEIIEKENIFNREIESVDLKEKGETINQVAATSFEKRNVIENKPEVEEINTIENSNDHVSDNINNKELFTKANINILNEKNKDIRVLLGEVEGSTRKIFWEFGDKGLANRHMLITGKSGQGKTYFIQCALKELSEQGVSSVIIDYTEGFKSSQLEPEFKEFLGDKLQQFIVARDKFPLNPFAKGKKELDDDFYIDEDNLDVAERFKSVIGSVYKELGGQQLNCIYQAVIRGMERYDGKLNLKMFRAELEEDETSYAKTALAQLNLLIDKNPFESNSKFDWSMLDSDEGKVFIIQLTGFTKDVQKIITEIILWDLWNYKLQNGSKDKPFAVVLDEAQNLNFKDDSPSTRILTEGRKFGWSAWFATQFLKGQMDKATISRLQNSGQKIYFAQTEEESTSMAATLATDVEERKMWANKLINLQKGTCISYGPIKDNQGKLMQAKPVKINIVPLNERDL